MDDLTPAKATAIAALFLAVLIGFYILILIRQYKMEQARCQGEWVGPNYILLKDCKRPLP